MHLTIVLLVALLAVTIAFNNVKLPSVARFQNRITSIRLSDQASASESSSVFIGNLPFVVDENQLSDLVTSKHSGAINNVKVIKDRTTGRSRGFGYLAFATKAEAEAAVNDLTGIEIDGRQLKVQLVIPRAEGEERPARTSRPREDRGDRPPEFKAFLGNLDFKTTQDDVLQLCDRVLGANVVKRVDLVNDRMTGRFRGFGYVHVESEEKIAEVITALNGSNLHDRQIRVDFIGKPRDDARPAFNAGGAGRDGGFVRQPRENKHSLYIGNLPWEATEEIISEMITDLVGPNLHSKVRVATDPASGKSKGFCHVDFVSSESMEKALGDLQGVEIYNRPLKVDAAQSKAPSSGGFRDGGFRDRRQ